MQPDTTILGICAGSHDASVAVLKGGNLVYASQAERYSRIKNDPFLNYDILIDACEIAGNIDYVCFYEKPALKKLRQLVSGQWKEVLRDNHIQDYKVFARDVVVGNKYLSEIPIKKISHHKSHAALAYASPYNKAIVLVIDSIGEFDTCSIWLYDINAKNSLIKLASAKYPDSLGLMYSAFTEAAGLKPNEEEYIYMGMSAFGDTANAKYMEQLIYGNKNKYNFHTGVPQEILDDPIIKNMSQVDMAACVQRILENSIDGILDKVEYYFAMFGTNNLVYSGGVALNCVANSRIQKRIPNVWIYNNPGDAGSSVGAALALYDYKVKCDSPYLGYNIKGKYPISRLLTNLLRGDIVGVANGKAEFGPRALGNRSLLANPLAENIKDRVNAIKKREKFRPFAPVILEEEFSNYYQNNGVKSSPYMQYVYKATDINKYTSILHIDNTSRVQTVNKRQHKDLYELLYMFYQATGCPMLLNTSLNIKGMPIVNNKEDASDFAKKYSVEVFTHE